MSESIDMMFLDSIWTELFLQNVIRFIGISFIDISQRKENKKNKENKTTK